MTTEGVTMILPGVTLETLLEEARTLAKCVDQLQQTIDTVLVAYMELEASDDQGEPGRQQVHAPAEG